MGFKDYKDFQNIRDCQDSSDHLSKEDIVDNWTGSELEYAVARLNERKGWNCFKTTDAGGDKGIDIIAIHKEDPKCKLIEVKNRKEKTGKKHATLESLFYYSDDLNPLVEKIEDKEGMYSFIKEKHNIDDVKLLTTVGLEVYSVGGFTYTVFDQADNKTKDFNIELYDGDRIVLLFNRYDIQK